MFGPSRQVNLQSPLRAPSCKGGAKTAFYRLFSVSPGKMIQNVTSDTGRDIDARPDRRGLRKRGPCANSVVILAEENTPIHNVK
jgi:hypothetical protein